MKIIGQTGNTSEYIVTMSKTEIGNISAVDFYRNGGPVIGQTFNVNEQWYNLRRAKLIAGFKGTIEEHFKNVLDEVSKLKLEELKFEEPKP
jgi:hypothetical protein